jgi:MoxR-like ATPase
MPGETKQFAAHVQNEVGKIIVGQTQMIREMVTVLLCGGHALLEGVPGIAKTLTVKALAKVCGLGFQRVQCTPDLMPADILGTNIYNIPSASFSFHRGPVFTDYLLVDEINRVPPRTQAALLECMEERQVTIDGMCYPLSNFFTVFATQNPVEFEGTYPLPEAQLDRFLFKIAIGYPHPDEEVEILNRFRNGFNPREIENLGLLASEPSLLEAARREVSQVRVEPGLYRYISEIVRKTRDWPALSLGGSPRATLNLMFAAKAQAALDSRDYIIPDDVKSVAAPVLRHRLVIKPEADLEGITPDHVVTEVMALVEVPQ